MELQKKGWNQAEIDQASAILDKSEVHHKHFGKIILWSSMFVVMLGNLLVALILIPFLPLMNLFIALSTIILLAGSMGFLYNLLINDIGHLEKKHHVWAAIIMPLIALFNMALVVLLSSKFGPGTKHNPWLLGTVFAVVFILPYLVRKVKK